MPPETRWKRCSTIFSRMTPIVSLMRSCTVPEPYFSQMQQQSGGKVLVDERTLWPNGRFVTTNLIVATKFLNAHPDVVKRLLEGQVAATDYVNKNPADAQKAANDAIQAVTQTRLNDAVVAAAWKNMAFTNDPTASSLATSAQNAQNLGLLDKVDLSGIYDLDPLNEVLAENGQQAVSGL